MQWYNWVGETAIFTKDLNWDPNIHVRVMDVGKVQTAGFLANHSSLISFGVNNVSNK